jgi:PAS domain S-box-containing protein
MPSDSVIVKGKEVMVVNDDPTQLCLLVELLKKGGHNVCKCCDVRKAVARLAGGTTPDLIITDLHMPGMDGWRFSRLLRSPEFQKFNETPILVVSATFSGQEATRINSEVGANAFLSSPVDGKRFMSVVRELLAGGTPSMASRALVADDDASLCELVGSHFEKHGYKVYHATSGKGARDVLSTYRPDVAILDHHLPDCKGGALLSVMKEVSPDTVTIMLTADPTPELSFEWMQEGASACVRKPTDPRFLVALSENARREKSLLRVEDVLNERTRELSDSETRYRALFEGIPDGVLVHDSLGRILDSNQVITSRLGLSREAVLEMRIQDILLQEDAETVPVRVEEAFHANVNTFESIYVSHSGEQIPVEIKERVIRWNGSNAILSVSRDLRERKASEREKRQLEARLREQQKLESLGLLAGGVAHEINNPINGIMNYAQLIVDRLETGHELINMAEEIIHESTRVADIVRNLLTFARQDENTGMERVSVNEIVDNTLTLIQTVMQRDQIVLDANIPEDLPPIMCKSRQIQQVILNLMTNARDSLNEKYPGEAHPDKRVELTSEENVRNGSNWIRLTVSDHGIGIPEEIKQNIFDPFFTTKPKEKGTGLGLSISHGIIREHGGDLSLDSKPGCYTRFHIDLPADEC